MATYSNNEVVEAYQWDGTPESKEAITAFVAKYGYIVNQDDEMLFIFREDEHYLNEVNKTEWVYIAQDVALDEELALDILTDGSFKEHYDLIPETVIEIGGNDYVLEQAVFDLMLKVSNEKQILVDSLMQWYEQCYAPQLTDEPMPVHHATKKMADIARAYLENEQYQALSATIPEQAPEV